MSDIGDIRVTTTVDTAAATSATEILTKQLLQLTNQINGYSIAAAKATNVYSGLNEITKNVGAQTKILTGFIQAYGAAQNTTNTIVQNANTNLKALDATMAKVGSSSTKMTAALSAQRTQYQAISDNASALNRALSAQAVQQWSNRAQASLSLTRQSILRTTAQTLAFTRALRSAFFSMADLEQQSVRVTKLLADNFGTGADGIAQARKETVKLGVELDQITRKYGLSRVLVQSIAGDFAELGIAESQALAGLVEITAMAERLGNVDITQSQKFVESMLQNILRVKREQAAAKGVSIDLTDAEQFKVIIAELKGQLAEFNYVENKTTLSLQDIAKAFPEVSAAATTFGLSMTEAAAMLAPMVAAGFQVGASANSIKVSLQRMVAMTKQNTKIIGALNEALGPDFDYSAGVSMENIQKLVNGFNILNETVGEQGTLELFARLFGVRQGPRMETSIRQAAIFQKNLKATGTTENRISQALERNINKRLEAAGLEQRQIKEIVDITNLHRDATENVNGVYTERAEILRQGQKDAFDDLNKEFATLGAKGADFISKIGTDYGKIIMSTGFRIEDTAQEQLKLELELALDTTITRYRILKEEILAIGRVLVTAFDPVIKFFLKIIQPIRDYLQNLSAGTKKILSFAVIFLALVPTVKIVAMSFKFFYATVIGGAVRAISTFGKFGSKLITVTDLITRGDRALKGWQKAIQISPDRILLTGRSRGAVADIAGLSPSLREARATAGATPGISSIKRALKESIGLPMASTAMAGLVETAGDAASAAADVAKSASGTLDALTSGVSDALKTGFKGTTFVSNRFLGNTFGGRGSAGGPGSVGGRGGGGAPSSSVDGDTARRVPARPVYGPPVPPPDTRPTFGPAFPGDTRPVYGPAFPGDTRPVYGPKIPKSATPKSRKLTVGDIITSRMPTSSGVKGVFDINTEKIPKIKGPKVGVKELKEILSRGAADATASVAATGAAIGETIAGVSEASTSATTAVVDKVKETTEKVKNVGSTGKRARKAAEKIKLYGSEIAQELDKVGVALPDSYQFLRNSQEHVEVTQAQKEAILKRVRNYAEAEKAAGRKLSDLSGPLGTIGTRGSEGSLRTTIEGVGTPVKDKATGKVKSIRNLRYIAKDIEVDFQTAEAQQIELTKKILAERLEQGGLTATDKKVITTAINDLNAAKARAIEKGAMKAVTGMSPGEQKAAVRAAEEINASRRKIQGTIESELLETQFKGLTISEAQAKAGVLAVPKETVGLSELQKANIEATKAWNEFTDLDEHASQQRVVEMKRRADAAEARVRKLQKTKGADIVPTTTTTEILPASQLSRDLQAFKEEQVSRKTAKTLLSPQRNLTPRGGLPAGLPEEVLGRIKTGTNLEKDIQKSLVDAVRASEFTPQTVGIKTAYEALLLEQIDVVENAIENGDKNLTDLLRREGYKTKDELKKITSKTSRSVAEAENRRIVRRLASGRVSLQEFDPQSPEYNPKAGERVFKPGVAKRIEKARMQIHDDDLLINRYHSDKAPYKSDEILAKQQRAIRESVAMRKAAEDAARDHSAKARSAREKAVQQFKRSRAALEKRFGSLAAAEKELERIRDIAADKEMSAAKSAATNVRKTAGKAGRKAKRAASNVAAAASSVAASVAAPVVTSAGAGVIKTPAGVSRVFFSDVGKAVTSTVSGASKTVGSEIARLLDDVLVKAIPAGFDPAKARVIRAVVGEVLAKTPITAASAATPAAQKFMATVLGTLGPDIARVIDSLTPQIAQAISAGGISAKGGIIQTAKSKAVGSFNKLKGLATAALVGNLANLRTGVEAAVFDAIAAAGYAIESTTSSVAEAIRTGTFTEAMLPGYLDELTEKRGRRSAAAVESGARGGAAAAEGKPKLSRGEINAARRKKRAVERLVAEGKAPDIAAATALYDEAVKSGDDAVKELIPGTRKRVKDAVKEVVEAPAKALTEASEAVGETVAKAKEEIKESLDEAVESVTPKTPASKTPAATPVTTGTPATGPPRARTPREIIETRAPLDIRKSRTDEIRSMFKEAGVASPDIKALREAEISAQKRVNKALENKAVFEKNVLDAKTPQQVKYWQKQVASADKELTQAKKSLETATKKLDTEQAKLTRSMVKVKKSMDASAAKPAPAVAPAAATAPTGAAAPKAPTITAPAAATAAMSGGAIVEKLDDVIVEFDRSLANFFKGPNFFQGPNYFAGPLTVMPNAKFKDTKKKFSDLSDEAKRKRLTDLAEKSERAKARIRSAGGADTRPIMGPAVPAPLTGLPKIKNFIMSYMKAGAVGAAMLGRKMAIGAAKGAFGIIGKSSAEFFKMSTALIDMYVVSMGKAAVSSRLAAGATKILTVAKGGLNIVAKATAAVLRVATNATLAFGRALLVTTRGEIATFIASLTKSRILKMWGFLLFTGMKPVIKAFLALTVAAARFIFTLKFSSIIQGFATLYQTVLRTALSFTALAIKLNAAMLMIAPIFIIVFTMIAKVKRGISGLTPATDNLKAAWAAFKDAIFALAKPLENMIGAFLGLGKQNDSIKRTGGIFLAISKAIRSAAEAFARFAKGDGQKYMTSVVVPILTRLINRFILLGGAIKDALGGKGESAGKKFRGFLYSLGYELVAFFGKFVSLAAEALEYFAPSLAKIINAIVAASISAFRTIMKFVREVMMLVGTVIAVVGAISGQIGIAIGGAAIAAGGGGLLLLDKKLAEFEQSAKTTSEGIGGFLANGIAGGVKGAANGLDKFKGFIGKKYKDTVGKEINEALGIAMQEGVIKATEKMKLKSADDANAAGQALGSEIAKGIKKGLQDLKEEFTDKFFGKADSEVDKFINKLKESLENQRDKALEAFDNQIDAIQALAEAEERLTAKIEYEEKRRELIRERALDKENYLRERKVAAYEGRSEDVRSLDLAFRKTSRSQEKDLKDLDLDRIKTLQAQNREDAIKVINKEKEKLVKEYEKMFKDFEERIELIKSRGFSTESEFKQMFVNLQNAASGFSDSLATTFEKSMSSLPSAIRENTDPSIGMFSMSMDKLVDEAKRSFGAGINSANSESILGAAYFLAKGMPDAFKQAFNSGIISQFVKPFTEEVKNQLTTVVPEDLWVKSAALAIMEMVNEMKRKLVALKGTLYDYFKDLFGKMTDEDWKKIFGVESAFADLESLAEYFKSLFPAAEDLKKRIVTIETVRSQEDSGGGDKKAKPKGGLTKGEEEDMNKKFGVPLDGAKLQELNEKYDNLYSGFEPKGDPKKGFFGKLKDIIVGIADYLGPVKTAILGFVGIVAGAAVSLPIWAAIKGLAVAIGTAVGIVPVVIGTIIGLLIYLYVRFESVRNVVNGIAIAIWDGLVGAFNYVKDLSISIKDAFVNMWNAIYPSLKRTFDFLAAGFEIAGGAIWEFVTLLVALVMKPLGSIFGGIARVIGSIIGIFKAIFGPAIKIILSALGVITVGFLKAIEVIIFYLDKFKEPIWNAVKAVLDIVNPIIEILIKAFTVPFDILFDAIAGVFNFISQIIYAIWDVIFTGGKNIVPILGPIMLPIFDILKTAFGILVSVFQNVFDIAKIIFGKVLDIIKIPFNWIKDNVGKIIEPIVGVFEKIGGVLSTIGSFILTLVLAPFKLFFEVIKKIAQNPVVDWFLRLAAMLGLVAAIIATWGVKIALESTWWVIKKVAGALADIAGFIYNVVVKAFTFMKDLLVGAWNTIYGVVKKFVDWWHDNVGSLWLLLIAGFVVAYEIVKRLWSFLSDVFVKVWDVVKAAAAKYFDFVKAYIGVVLDVFKVLAGWLGTAFTVIWDILKKAASLYWDYLKFAAGIAWSVLKTVGEGIWDALGWIWDRIGTGSSIFWEGLKIAAKFAWSVLKAVGEGIWDAIGWVWGNIGTIAKAFWDGLKTAAQTVWNFLKSVGSGIWDGIGWVWSRIDDVAKATWDGIKAGAQIAWDFLKTVGEGIWENLGWIWDVISSAVQKVWDVIVAGWDMIGPIFEQLWSWLWDGIKWAWDQLTYAIEFYWGMFKKFWGWVGPVLGQLWDWLWTGIKWVWDQITEGLQFYWDLFKKVWGWLQPILSQLWDWLWTAIKFAWDQITEALSFYWDLFKKVWGWLGPILKEFAGWIWDKIKLGWDALVTAVQKVWDIIKLMWENVFPILKKMAEFIKDGIGVAIDTVITIWNGLKTAFQNVFDFIKPIIQNIGDFIRTVIGGAIDFISAAIGAIPSAFKTILNSIAGLFNTVVEKLGNFAFPKTILNVPIPVIGGKKVSDFIRLPYLPTLYNGGKVGSYMKGGMAYGYGGMTDGFAQQAVPAILHGGEYVINHKAVKRIGTDTLDALNNMKLSKPRYPNMPSIPNVTMPNLRIDNSTMAQAPAGSSTQNVNIYVDTFVGEPEWFNSMMKEYNTKVLPRNQKAAGLENRVIRTYNGLNRGG